MVSLLCDLGSLMTPVLAIDRKSHQTHSPQTGNWSFETRRCAYLRMEDEVRPNRLGVRSVRSEKNVADLGTEALSNAASSKHSIYVGVCQHG